MSDEKPAEVRAAIESAIEALNRTRGFLPVNVGFQIMRAHGKLNIALVAIDAWEAQLRHETICENAKP